MLNAANLNARPRRPIRMSAADKVNYNTIDPVIDWKRCWGDYAHPTRRLRVG